MDGVRIRCSDPDATGVPKEDVVPGARRPPLVSLTRCAALETTNDEEKDKSLRSGMSRRT